MSDNIYVILLCMCTLGHLSIFIYDYDFIIILFIVQCWTQASKPEPLKKDTQKEKKKINLYSKL